MGQTINKIVVLCLTTGLYFSLLFAKAKYAILICKDIKVTIKHYPGQSFISSKEIVNLLQLTHKISLGETPLKNINTYAIQHQLKNHPLIKNILVYKTWNGTLKIYLESKYLIARIINLIDQNNSQIYLDEQGNSITLKGPPLLRLLVITGKNIIIKNSILRDKRLLALLHYIHQDDFWRRQITSLQIEDNGKIMLGTQVGDHQIAFGKAENIDEKFEKLQLFYSQVIPYKGWKTYHRVNLEFKDQLICE